MWHLYKSEILRFRKLAIALGIGVLLLLWGLSQSVDLLAVDAAKIAVALLACAVAGLSLGLYQIGTYKRLSQWTSLIHRPLTPGRIFASLAGAAATLLGVAFVAPIVSMIAYVGLLTAQVVDPRHYLLGPLLYGVLVSYYLIGCFISLSPSRAAFLVLVLPHFFLTREAPGLWIFAPMAVVVAWLAYIAFVAFKPDLTTHHERPAAVVATALPIQYALMWLLAGGLAMTWSLGTIYREHGINGLSTFAWDDYFGEGTLPHVQYLNEGVIAHGLAGAGGGRERELATQIELADVFELPGPRLARFHLRHQLMHQDRHTVLDASGEEIVWTFSHEQMLFHGRDTRTGKAVAWLGRHGRIDLGLDVASDQRFASVPYAIGDQILTRRRLYQVDEARERVHLRHELPAGESWATPLVAHSSFVVAKSDRNLYFFEPRDLERQSGYVEPTSAVPLPGSAGNLDRVHVAELIDSYVVSFVFGRQAERGYHPAEQVVVEVGLDGRQEIVARRPLGLGTPPWYRHRGFIVSPVLRHTHDLAWAAIAPTLEGRVGPADIIAHPKPAAVVGWALLVAIGSAALTALLAPGRQLSRRARRASIIASLLLGAPALLSLLFLTTRREPSVAAARPSSNRSLAPGGLTDGASWSV